MKKNIHFMSREFEVLYESEADESVIDEIFRDHDYRICDIVINNAKQGILDIGAHIGMFSLYARALNTEVPVYSFEPDINNFRLLKENIKINRVKNIHVSNTGIMPESGEYSLYLHEDNHNHSFVTESGDSRKVYCATLERVFVKNRISSCDLVKMDAEGAEFSILPSLPTEIFAKIKAFIIEYHSFDSHSGNDIAVLLKKRGFLARIFPSRYDARMGMVFAWKR